MRMSRKWARRGRVMVYTGIAGWIGMELLHLIALYDRGPQPASDWIWVLGALFFCDAGGLGRSVAVLPLSALRRMEHPYAVPVETERGAPLHPLRHPLGI